MGKPITFSSPRAARKYAEAHAVEAYGAAVEAKINEGHRVINVPRGVARVLGEQLSTAGWAIEIRACEADNNLLSLLLGDPNELAPTEVPASDPPAPSEVQANGMTASQIAALGLEPAADPAPVVDPAN